MKIMLMSRFERHQEMSGYAQELTDMGHIVTSRWLNPENHFNMPEDVVRYDEKGFSDVHAEYAATAAEMDMQDTIRCHIGVLFSEHPTVPVVRGARQREMGMLMGWNILYSALNRLLGPDFGTWMATNGLTPKRLIVVGPRENIYDCLSSFEVYPTWEEAKAAIGYSQSASLVTVEQDSSLVGADGSPLK